MSTGLVTVIDFEIGLATMIGVLDLESSCFFRSSGSLGCSFGFAATLASSPFELTSFLLQVPTVLFPSEKPVHSGFFQQWGKKSLR